MYLFGIFKILVLLINRNVRYLGYEPGMEQCGNIQEGVSVSNLLSHHALVFNDSMGVLLQMVMLKFSQCKQQYLYCQHSSTKQNADDDITSKSGCYHYFCIITHIIPQEKDKKEELGEEQ
jgi:hypothetical protein